MNTMTVLHPAADFRIDEMERIRCIMVQHNNKVSIRTIQKELEEQGITRSLGHIFNTKKKIERERAKKLDHSLLNVALAQLQDSSAVRATKLWEIVNNPGVAPKVVVAALKEIRENEHGMMQVLFDAGVFKRDLGTVSVRHGIEEKKAQIMTAFGNLLGTPIHDIEPTDIREAPAQSD